MVFTVYSFENQNPDFLLSKVVRSRGSCTPPPPLSPLFKYRRNNAEKKKEFQKFEILCIAITSNYTKPKRLASAVLGLTVLSITLPQSIVRYVLPMF